MTAGALPLRIGIQREHWLARLCCPSDLTALILGADGRLGVERQGKREEVVLSYATTVFAALVILHLRSGKRREAFAIPTVAVGTEAHRRLRIWLRWRARAEAVAIPEA